MSYRDWHVGMKVVCVSDLVNHPARTRWNVAVPDKGEVYTIREIFKEPRHSRPNAVFIRLEEVINQPAECGWGPYEAGFDARHFRPVQPRKTDISIFTAMLHDQRQKVSA